MQQQMPPQSQDQSQAQPLEEIKAKVAAALDELSQALGDSDEALHEQVEMLKASLGGGEVEEEPAESGSVSMEAGAKKVKPVL